MALGLLLLITSIVRQDLDTNSIILIVALFAFGFGSIMRSISQRMAKEDKLEELDERNRLIALKSKSKSFQLTQIISFMLMLALLVMGKVSGYEGFIAMGVGLAFAFAISMFSELFTYMYAVGVLPALTEGQVFESVAASVTEHFTSPPKPYTEDTLLSAMENAGKEDMPDETERKGLGTPATRAAIIEKLVSGGFVERKGKSLIPTKAGVNLVTVLPELLTSPKLTADWEQRLNEVAKGQASPEDFMDGIEAMAAELVRKYSHISEDGQKLFQPEKETVGLCPRCGKPVYEGKKNFACSDRACQFVMWKNDRFWTSRRKELNRKMAADLLKKGRTSVKGMWSEKKGSTYDAVVVLDDTGGKYVNFKLEFPKRKDSVHGKK